MAGATAYREFWSVYSRPLLIKRYRRGLKCWYLDVPEERYKLGSLAGLSWRPSLAQQGWRRPVYSEGRNGRGRRCRGRGPPAIRGRNRLRSFGSTWATRRHPPARRKASDCICRRRRPRSSRRQKSNTFEMEWPPKTGRIQVPRSIARPGTTWRPHTRNYSKANAAFRTCAPWSESVLTDPFNLQRFVDAEPSVWLRWKGRNVRKRRKMPDVYGMREARA